MRNLLLSTTLLLSSACNTTEADTLDDVSALRSLSWDDVICTQGTATGCFAHSPSADELWQPVVSWCDLHGMVEAQKLTPTDDGWFYACDPGGRPETFTDVLCFYDSFTSIVCYGGHDGWYTKVTPECARDTYTATPWPTGSCDGDGVGTHFYDTVRVDPYQSGLSAQATDGADAFIVLPECALPTGGVNAADPFSCEPSGPCCSCDAEGWLACVSFTEGHTCPVGTSTTTMVCDDLTGTDGTDTGD